MVDDTWAFEGCPFLDLKALELQGVKSVCIFLSDMTSYLCRLTPCCTEYIHFATQILILHMRRNLLLKNIY